MKRDYTTPIALVLGATLTAAAFLMAFTWAPLPLYEDGLRWDLTFQIFYFHVPVAEASFLVFAFAAVYAIRFLISKDRVLDTKSRIAMETTLLFIVLTMATGMIWNRARWGVWWIWEPRLTTYFILTLLAVGYFVLRRSVADEERRASYAAVFCIIAFIDAPISFFITRIMQSESSHPVVFENGGLADMPGALITFITAQVGMLLFGYVIYRLRMREEVLKERLEAVKTALGG